MVVLRKVIQSSAIGCQVSVQFGTANRLSSSTVAAMDSDASDDGKLGPAEEEEDDLIGTTFHDY